VGRTTRSDQLRRRAARDNPRVADHVNLVRANGQPVCRCRVANSFASRFRGLMGVAQLPPSTGLLLPRTSSVHTHFMRFPIDVVFLDSERRIVSVTRAVRPWRFARAKAADSVLELAAGECDRLGLTVGTALIEAEG
jgi:uncharacterized membrane protein (UPF0127 family)